MSFKEQIMSKDKYPYIFLRQLVAIVFVILQILFAKRAALKIGEFLGHVTCLDQSRVDEIFDVS